MMTDVPERLYLTKQKRGNLKFNDVTFAVHGIGARPYFDHGGMHRVSIYMQETILNTVDFSYLLSVIH